ncbi:hypothetical protein [Hanstruepera marina]|uniref:hypothetical protein n=1 Tax=Hanstruepera marina TaxID=2873265 RepID=UPI001CA69E72|nr:hypothetical protein [Hanstruepera marina]
MKLRTIVGVLLVLIICSCIQKKSQDKLNTENYSNQRNESKSGLRIENSPTRGTGFSDLSGKKYGMVYITTTITNDSTIPILLQIAFSKEYDYPPSYGDEQFKIIILPNEWTQAGVEITDDMMNELLQTKNKHFLNETLKPNKRLVATIGLIRPIRPNLCSATPYGLLEISEKENFTSCSWTTIDYNNQNQSYIDLSIGLKVGFCTTCETYKSCKIISCGEISFLKN